jgi:hypothetical protein
MFRLRSLCLGATRDQAGEPRRLPRSIALLAAVVLFLVLAPPASAIQFVSTWGWGVEDGANQYETCTSACQQGIYGSGAGQFGRPFGIATDSSGNVYVGDYHHNRIEKFSSSGAFISAWGWGVTDGAARYEICTSSCQAGISGSGDDQFADPVAIATDPEVLILRCLHNQVGSRRFRRWSVQPTNGRGNRLLGQRLRRRLVQQPDPKVLLLGHVHHEVGEHRFRKH